MIFFFKSKACRFKRRIPQALLPRVLLISLILPAGCGLGLGNGCVRWEELPAIPDANGFAASFAGTVDGSLVVAGGANFPDSRPWNGGTKTWYDRIFILDSPTSAWREETTRLPRPVAYGTSLTLPQGVLCVGGNDAHSHFSDVFLLQKGSSGIVVKTLPSLPLPLAYCAAALMNGRVYVAGGQENETLPPQNVFFEMDTSPPISEWRWKSLAPCPGRARILPVAAAQDGAFYLIGGADLVFGSKKKTVLVREYLRDAWRYKPGAGWDKIAPLPWPVVAAPSPAPNIGDSYFYILGCDDGELSSNHHVFTLKDRHPGFRRDILVYDTVADKWQATGKRYFKAGEDPEGNPNATRWAAIVTPAVEWNGRIIIPGGEARPGVRTPRVESATLKPNSCIP